MACSRAICSSNSRSLLSESICHCPPSSIPLCRKTSYSQDSCNISSTRSSWASRARFRRSSASARNAARSCATVWPVDSRVPSSLVDRGLALLGGLSSSASELPVSLANTLAGTKVCLLDTEKLEGFAEIGVNTVIPFGFSNRDKRPH